MTDHVERRRHERLERPELLVTLEGRTYQARNWSLGGVLLTGYDGRRGLGDLLTGEFGFADASERCPFEGLVVRVNRARRELAFGFAGLDDEAFNLLNSHAAI